MGNVGIQDYCEGRQPRLAIVVYDTMSDLFQLERLAAEHRDRESVLVVTSDAAVRGTAGQEVGKRGSHAFLAELDASVGHREDSTSRVRDRLDPETRERLERLRRGGG